MQFPTEFDNLGWNEKCFARLSSKSNWLKSSWKVSKSAMTKHLLFSLLLIAAPTSTLLVAPAAWAQKAGSAAAPSSGSGTSAADIEGLFSEDPSADSSHDQLEPEKAPDRPAPTELRPPTVSGRTNQSSGPRLKEVTDLGRLEPLKDISVIQRRYLPKTGRFEIYLGAATVLNDVFFSNYGLSGRFAYYFQERYGIEFISEFLSNNPRGVVNDLRDHGVATKTFVAPKTFYGVDFKWSPIYGKMTWRNRRITPFDMYFSSGLGVTGTNQSGSEPTLHLGTGQVFALSKGMAFRWDLSWNFFNSKSTVSGSDASSLYNNLLVTLGVSFFFPEATYR
jgi:outer membrane beta-barrel protein